jgi:hypothetical protein
LINGRYNCLVGSAFRSQLIDRHRDGEKRLMRAGAWCFLLLWILRGTPPPSTAPKRVTLAGKVMTLTAAFEARGLALKTDPESTEKQVVILGKDGAITPLVSDQASRALFLDKRLLDRQAEIHGQRFAGVPYLQVVTFQVEDQGRLHTPEYFCEVCSISVPYPQICPCCQGSMELRMKP